MYKNKIIYLCFSNKIYKKNIDRPNMKNYSKRRLQAFTILCGLLLLTGTFASNVMISNTILTGKNSSAGLKNPNNFTLIKFDINWDNSFRLGTEPNNYDAAWVFAKYRIPTTKGGDGVWKHATLSTTGFTAPTGSTVAPSADGLGAFIYRAAAGSMGKNAWKNVQLQWNYGSNGVGDSAAVEIQLFAIEMVYVPTGSFYVGTGANPTEVSSFTKANVTLESTVPFQITEARVAMQGNNLTSSPTSLSARSYWDLIGTAVDTLSSVYPTGYNSFYCMKYEITQQQYVDFLNTLNFTQQSKRTTTLPSSVVGTGAMVKDNAYRNGIDVMTPGLSPSTPAIYGCNLNDNTIAGEAGDGKSLACNWLNWADLTAYLDWSGLRPMTELEFEKACRGTLAPVAGEYAWGSTAIGEYTGVLGVADKKPGSIAANACYGNHASVQGPVAVDLFETSSQNRVGNGTTYYGAFNMSGNVYERVVALGSKVGKKFNGSNGNGTLNPQGASDVPTWPGIDSEGSGFKGGTWYSSAAYLRVSDRSGANLSSAFRLNTTGGRGVRSEK